MPNKRHNDMTTDGGVPTNAKPGKKGSVSEGKGIGWAGLPGKTGPERSAGVKKVKTSHVSKGVQPLESVLIAQERQRR